MSKCEKHVFETIEVLYDYSGITQYVADRCKYCGLQRHSRIVKNGDYGGTDV